MVDTGVAQLAEHWIPNPGVGGSSPSARVTVRICYGFVILAKSRVRRTFNVFFSVFFQYFTVQA